MMMAVTVQSHILSLFEVLGSLVLPGMDRHTVRGAACLGQCNCTTYILKRPIFTASSLQL